MKSKFNYIILLFSLGLSLKADSSVVRIRHAKNKKTAKLVAKIIREKFYIPDSFIRIESTNCLTPLKYKFEFCIDETGELTVLDSSPSFYKKNLKIFRPKNYQQILK